MKRAWVVGVLLAAMLTIGSATLAIANEETSNKSAEKIEKLKRHLEQKNLSQEQIKKIIKTIKNLSRYLTAKEVDDIIEAYMSDGEFVYTKFSKEELEGLRKLEEKYPPSSSPSFGNVRASYNFQKDGRMLTRDFSYCGIRGYVYPGTLQLSPSGTELHYVTSHIGEPVNGEPHWVEVGVQRYDGNYRYILFTFDSDASDPKLEHFDIDPHVYHEFLILVLPYNSTHSLYAIWWDGNKIRSGYNVMDTTLQVDEVHEAFSNTGTFTPCNSSYFKQSTLYTSSGGTAWNDAISDDYYALSPMKANRWLEYYNSYSYWKFETWID